MSNESSNVPSPAPSPVNRWLLVLGIVGAAAVLVVVGIGVFGYLSMRWFHEQEGRPVPSFPSLASAPDVALRGTVAYFDNGSRCVRIVAASGTPSKDVYCLASADPEMWREAGKPAGPQLVWRPDGRLEITMFGWVPSKETKGAPPLTPTWQKIVDVRTGSVEDVPRSALPAAPLAPDGPMVNALGERVNTTFDASTGKAKVTLTTSSGTRELLAVHGPGEYTYRFEPAFWAPNGEWITTLDNGGRILIITPTEPAVTRLLVTNTSGGAGGGTAGPPFAVTADDILTAAP